MQKLPVFATAREVYAFVWRDIGAILRLSWFPLLVVTVVSFFAVRASLDAFREAVSSGKIAPQDMSGGFWDIANNLVSLVGSSIVAVALHRVILFDDRQPGTFVYFRFGKVEGLFVLLPIVIFIAILLLSAVFGPALGSSPDAQLGFLVLVIVVAFFFLAVRFSLVFPNIVVERRFDFAKVWSLTRGHFWRLVALWLVVLVPAALVFLLIQSLFFTGFRYNPGEAGGMTAIIDQFETVLMRTIVLSFPASIIFGALGVGVLSYSYKALSGLRPDEIVTPPA